MLIDPAIQLACAWALAAVFATGLAHKLRSPSTFVATLGNYRLLPRALLVPAAGLVIAGESLLVPALLVLPGAAPVCWGAFALLVLYTTAIGINLARGRRDIDCGCSGPALRQTLSGALLWRNAVLLAIAAVALLPVGDRALSWLDFLSAGFAVATVVLIYTAGNQLIANAPRLKGMFS